MFDTQDFPWSQQGPRSQLPSPAGIQESYTFFAKDTNQGFILVINPYTKRREWRQMFGNGSPLKFSGGIQVVTAAPVAGYLADEVGLAASAVPFGYVFPTARTVLGMAVSPSAASSEVDTVVALYKNGFATPISVTIPPGTIPGTVFISTGSVAFIPQVDLLDIGVTNPGTTTQGPKFVLVTAVLDVK